LAKYGRTGFASLSKAVVPISIDFWPIGYDLKVEIESLTTG